MANKNTINLQLVIDTAFKNVESSVKDFQNKLSNINVTKGLQTQLTATFENQVKEIQKTLKQVGSFDFNTGNSQEYVTLVAKLKEEYRALSAMTKQYQDTFSGASQSFIAQQQSKIAQIDAEINAKKQQVDILKQGEEAYNAQQQGATNLSEKEKELAATYENNIPQIETLNEDIQKLTKSRSAHQGQITRVENAQKAQNAVIEEEQKLNKSLKTEIEAVVSSKAKEVDVAKQVEAAKKAEAKASQEAQKAAEKEAKAKAELQEISSTFVKDITKETVGTDELTSAISSQVIQWTSFHAVVNTAQRAITDIISTYQELDDNLSAISAVSGISTQELWGDMPSMIDNANELALTVEDLTNGMLLFYQQGLSAAETEVRLEAAGKMAAISQQDLATAVDQLTSAMNAFNMTGDDAQKVVDVYAALAGATAVDVQELAAAMSRTASIAQNAGLTFEETAAFLTTMEETTRLSAETIGNSFKSIIARFTQLRTSSEALEDGVDANKVETALKTAGVALRDANGEFRDLGDVLMELSSVWDTLDTNTQRYIATTAAGTQQQSNFIALISQYQSNMDNLNTAMNSAGAAEQQFQAISENLSSALKRLDNGFTAIKTSWTDSINVLTLLVDALSGLLRVIALIPAPIQLVTVAFGAMVAKQVAAELQSQRNVAQMFKEAAAQQMLETVQKSSLSTSEKIAVLKELLRAKSKGLTEAQVAESLVLKGLTEAEKAQEVAAYSEVTANTAVKLSFDLIKTSALKAGAAIKTFATQHPIILAISLAISAAAAAFSFFQSQAEKAKQKIEDLTTAVQDFNSEAQESQSIADSLDGYITSLQDAYAAGEDLTSIRKEIEKSGYLEQTGVDVLTASYDELLSTLQEVSAEQEKQASISRGKALLSEMELDAAEGKESLKNTSIGSGKGSDYELFTFFDENGKRTDFGKGRNQDLDVGYVTEAYNLTVKYPATINGQEYLYDTVEERDEAINQAIEDAKAPKNQYSNSSAMDIVNYIEEIDQDFFTALNISSEQAAGLVQIWGAKIGGAIYNSEKEQVEPAFQSFITDIGQAIVQSGNQLNVSTEDLFNYLNGNFSTLNQETISAIQEALQNAVDQSEGKQKDQLNEFVTNSKDAYNNALDELKNSLTQDYQLLSDSDAQDLGYDALQKIQDALESGGKDFAQTVAQILTGNISEALEGTDFEGDAEQIVTDLQNVLDNTDVSNLDSLSEAINFLTESEYANIPIVQDLILYYQQLQGELVDSNNVMVNAYQTAENYENALTAVANAASGTVISWSDVESVMTAAGLSANDASKYFERVAGGFTLTAQNAQLLVDKLAGATNATYEQAISQQESAKAFHKANAEKITALAKYLRSLALKAQAEGEAIVANKSLVSAEVTVAEAIDQVNQIAGGEASTITQLAVNTSYTADQLTAFANELTSMAAEERSAAAAAQQNIDMLKNMQTGAASAANSWRDYGDAAKSSGGGSNAAADAVNEAKEALEAQKEALQKVIDQWEDYKEELESQKEALEEQKDALEELNDKLKDNLELYLDLIKTKLEDEIDRQTTAVEAYYDAIKNTIQSQIDAFEDQLDELKRKADELQDKADELQEEAEKQEDSLNKLYEAATSYYEAVQSGIDNEINLQDDAIEKNEYKISLLEQQKEAIQEQIDNLDKAADSESKLLNLEKARDALANARNQKTRMVLTNGGGWRLKTDTAAVQEAQSNLATSENDYQKELLERQQEKLDDQISELEEQNDKIEDIKDKLEEQKDSIDNIIQDWDDAADNLGETTSELEEQTKLLEKIASATEAERNEMLQGFQSNVAQNNNQFQTAADAANEANQASNEYDYQNNADNQDSISAAIEALKQQQNLTDEALKQYFENLLSNNAEEIAIQQQMQELVNQMIQNGNLSLDSFLEYQGQINEALQAANEFASNQAEYINKINETIGFYEEWSNRLDMTSSEINERQQIMNEINNATLASLLEGGSTFNQLQNQYNEIVRNNDEAVKIQEQIDAVDLEIEEVQSKIDELKNQQQVLSDQQKALDKANTDSVTKATNSAGSGVSKSVSNASTDITEGISGSSSNIVSSVDNVESWGSYLYGSLTSIKGVLDKINEKEFTININERASSYQGGVGGASKGGSIGFSHGGVDDFTKTVAVHGTKNRPELVLNNSQSAALFKYIDSMTRIPTLSSAGSARNALQAFNNTTNNTTNEGTSFTGCEFNIESNANNLDSLVRELKQSSSIKRK